MSGNLAYRGENVSSVYIEEKSSYVISELVEILHTLESSEISDKDKLEQIHGCAEAALYDALKIIATTIDAPWQVEDSRLIANCGDAKIGWEAVQYRYTGKMEEIWSGHPFPQRSKGYFQAILDGQSLLIAEVAVRKEFCAALKPLLDGTRGEVRTAINVIMDSYPLPDCCYLRMNYLLDQVNMGNISWEDFCLRFTANLSYLEEKLSSEKADSYIKGIYSAAVQRKAAKLKGEYMAPVDAASEPSWEQQYLREYAPEQTER